MKTVKERIKIVIGKMNLTQNVVEKSMNLSRGSMGNQCKLNSDSVSLFLIAYPFVSADYIMREVGEMFNFDMMSPEQIVDIVGETKAKNIIFEQNNNGNINNGNMTESTMSVDANNYAELLKEKDERIADLKETINMLKEHIEMLKNGK